MLEAELLEVADEPVSSYSYGMRRRLLLAEALVGSPRLLVLDEPTLGLDVSGRRWLARLLHERSLAGLTACLATNDTELEMKVGARRLTRRSTTRAACGTGPGGRMGAMSGV